MMLAANDLARKKLVRLGVSVILDVILEETGAVPWIPQDLVVKPVGRIWLG